MATIETTTEQRGGSAGPSEVGEVQAGNPLPIGGAHQQGRGVNFVLFSRHATGVRLEFYRHPEDASPSRVIEFDPVRHRTGDIWHVWVRGIPAGQLYGYRVEGPYLPDEGHRFNSHKLLVDPYARAIAGIENWDFQAARGYDSSSSRSDPRQKSLACLILGRTEPDLFLLFNAGAMPVDFSIPALPAGKTWRLAVNTSRSAPDDFFEPGKEPSLQGQISFRLEARSSAVFVTDGGEVTREN